MREYDDSNIRRYARVLQRMVMVAVVIIAVPVTMWTVSTFIGSYVAQPKIPALQHLALTEPTQSLPPASTVAADPAPVHADAVATANDGRAPFPDANALKEPLVGPATEDATPESGPPLGGTVRSSPPILTEAGSSTSPPVTAPAAAPTDATAPPTPSPTESVTPRIATDGPEAAAAPTDRGFAWPDPNTDSPSFGASPQPPRIAETAAPETLPAPEPIKGRIPLPRHRPSVKAMTAAANLATTGSIAPAGRVPLPRVRPTDAPVGDHP